MKAINKKVAMTGDWWRKLVHGLRWSKNAGLPLSEKYWQNLNDKIMSQIIDHDIKSEPFVDKKKISSQLSVEI